jgi:hypothetical protein
MPITVMKMSDEWYSKGEEMHTCNLERAERHVDNEGVVDAALMQLARGQWAAIGEHRFTRFQAFPITVHDDAKLVRQKAGVTLSALGSMTSVLSLCPSPSPNPFRLWAEGVSRVRGDRVQMRMLGT